MVGWKPLSARTMAFACALLSFGLVLELSIEHASARAGRRTPFGSDLLRNGGAERGGASYPDAVAGRVPGWTRSGRFTVTVYGVHGFLPKEESKRIGGRANHFACGSVSRSGRAWQRVDLVGRGSAIDTGSVDVILRAYVSAPADGGDRGRIIVRFLDGRAKRIGRAASRWVDGTALRFVSTKVSTVVPRRTRSLLVQLKGERKSGLYCNVYFDNVDLRIQPA